MGVDRPCLDNVERLDHGCLRMVSRMSEVGILIDQDHFKRFAIYLKSEEDRISSAVYELTGHRVNLASPDQLAELLFKKLEIKPKFNMKLVPTGKREVINDKVLESIKEYHPVIPMIQDFTECNKLRTSFAETLPRFADAAGRIHADFKLTRVITGRIAMANPNLMGQPTRSELGKKIREGFIPPPGRMLGQIDLSQAQMRLAAHVSGCQNMLNVFWRNGDIHSETASMMFRIPIDKLDKYKHRYPAKRAGFGVLFMITGAGLVDQMQSNSDPSWTSQELQSHRDYWTVQRCDEVLRDWYAVYSEIKEWQNAQILRARRYGMCWDPLFGRPRLIPDIRSSHKHIVADACRSACNTPIVQCETGVMKLVMAETLDTIDKEKWDLLPLCQVHDSILFEGDKNLPEHMERIKKIVANAVPLDVPMLSDVEVGEGSWGSLH